MRSSLLLAILVSTLSVISWVSDVNSDRQHSWQTELLDNYKDHQLAETADLELNKPYVLASQLSQIYITDEQLHFYQQIISHKAAQFHQAVFLDRVFPQLQKRNRPFPSFSELIEIQKV